MPTTGGDSEGFSAAQLDVLSVVNLVASSLSFLGATFICFMFLYFQRLRSFAFKLIFWLALSDWVNSVGNLLGRPTPDSSLCYAQAVLSSIGEIASILWTTTIAFTIHQVFIKRRLDAELFYASYHKAIWGFTTVVTVLPALTSSYGQAGGFCWIKGDNLGSVWRMVQFYIPLWIVVAYTGWVYYTTWKMVQRDRSDASVPSESLRMMRRMRMYPVVLVVCYTFATINRVHQIFSSQPIFVLTLLHALFAKLLGFGNALVYGMTPSVLEAARELGAQLRAVCCPGGHVLLPDGSAEPRTDFEEAEDDGTFGDSSGRATGADPRAVASSPRNVSTAV